MTKTLRRGLSMLLVLAMCLSFLPIININSDAAEIDYVYNGNYIYNWGTRGEVATTLSPNAEDFYTGSASYDVLSSYSGGTGKSDAPSSQLYKALKNLMTSAQSYTTSYNATKELFKYTDCENSGGKISSFYSGKAIGPSWDGNWNREHTWPNSKGLGGSDEDDIMMLRPTSISENSSRGNTAYGKSSGYYNPNSESGGKYDLRGDVARIFLYVYVRWGNTSYAWGTSGVMESVDVLLEWMEADPVDTWELGRNDSVESITGTRNVFVDYPELAFILFGEEIPDGMSTPSGSGSGDCGHNNYDSGVVVVATCTSKGYTVYTCRTAGCGYSYKTNVVDAKGHSYSSGVCSDCGESEPVKPYYVTSASVGVAYKLGLYSTEKGAEYYFTGSMSGYYGQTETDYSKGVDVYLEETSGGYYLYFKNSSGQKQYINLVVSGTYRNFTYGTTATTVYTWDSENSTLKTTLSSEVVYIGTYGSYVTMGVLQTSKLKDGDYFARLYTMSASSGGESGGESGGDVGDTACQHSYTSKTTAPTCTKEGYTTYTCSLCADSYVSDKVAATGHSYNSAGTCSACGAVKPSSSSATLSFTSTASRTEFSKTKQVWVQNGITITNDKASSTVDVADYSNPARFYAGSNLTISYPGMTKLEINCSGLGSKYVSSWLNVPAGATATNNSGVITIVFDKAVDSLTYTGLAAQSRAYDITVYAEVATSCTHSNTVISGAFAATCTTDGHTGTTSCTACGEVLDAGKVIPKSGHNFGTWYEKVSPTCTEAGIECRDCQNCGYSDEQELAPLGHNYVTKGAIPASCTAEGHTGVTSCTVCGDVSDEGKVIPKLDHEFGEFYEKVAPTCTEAGIECRECENCGYSEEEEIPAIGHSDNDGNEQCDNCDTNLSDGSDDNTDGPSNVTGNPIISLVAVAITVSIVVLVIVVCLR